MRKYLIFIMLLFFIVRVQSSVVSINSYGDGEGVLIPDEAIEGFFFTEQPSPSEPPGGGGATIQEFAVTQSDFPFLCNYSGSFINRYKLGEGLNYTYFDFYDFKQNISSVLNKNIEETSLQDFLDNFEIICDKFIQAPEIPQKRRMIILIIIFVSVMIFLGVYLREKLYYLAMVLAVRSKALRKR